MSDYEKRINTKAQVSRHHAEDKALKFDDSKPMLELISPTALMEEGRVLAFGANKYGANNWRNGMAWSRLIGASLRHITAFNNGEDLDDETKLNHLAHARCCLGMLIEYYEKGLGKDDRVSKTKK